MFVDAIEIAAKFTRPIHSVSRNYGASKVHPGAATLFFVNSDGWALTCGHVAKGVLVSPKVMSKYGQFKSELVSRQGEKNQKQVRKELQRKYGYSKETTVELLTRFMNCVSGDDAKLKMVIHKSLDIALLRFEKDRLLCNSFAVFPKDTSELKQGKFVCRLGFPFAEFANFAYDVDADAIRWTETGRTDTPRFPIEGMVTRHVAGPDGNMSAFEVSTPGLRGQSGGPAFDSDGKVWGMQAGTKHLDLDFDVEQEVMRQGLAKRVQDSAFLHVGRCIHVDALKSFMQENDVRFDEG